MPWFKNFLLIFLLLFMLFGAFQKKFGVIESKSLNGNFTATPKPSFSCSTWMSGAYQEQYRVSLEDSVGFKSDLVRLFNQVDYSLFTLPHAAKIIPGKDGYLFADTYINAWLGRDFIGKPFIENKINSLKFIQDYLWKEKGIYVMVVFTPAKGYFYPEFIPDRFAGKRHEARNYEYYLECCKKMGINYIDFSEWFLRMKDTSRYNLYPKAGIHWSSYGSFLCADSLRRYLEVKLSRKLPRMILDSVELSSETRDDDGDIELTMNMIRKIPQTPLAYPQFHFSYDSALPKPNALVIGDSFYWYWYRKGIIANTFNNSEFWYYNWDVYPESFTAPKLVGSTDFPGGILKQNVIILMQTNGGFGELGYGWIDMAYDYLYPGKSVTHEAEAQMSANPSWLKTLEAKAKERNITIDYMMRLDAIYGLNSSLKQQGKMMNKY